MRTVLTAKLKWHTTPERFCALRAAQLAYHDALNSLNSMSRSTFAVGKLSNAMGWQDGTYHDIRSRRDLPAPIPCSVPRQVDATYQTLWTKVTTTAAARTAGQTKKRSRDRDRAVKVCRADADLPTWA